MRVASAHDHCVHELFEQQAAANPAATAVVCDGRHLTYGELNGRANQLAHVLRLHQVGPGTRVGICLDRRPEMVVAVLASLKAGAAYVPLEPTSPRQRLAFMAADAGVQLVLTHAASSGRVAGLVEALINLDRDADLIDAQPAHDLGRTSTPDDPAYVMFTSGSTGRPKGALVLHRGLVNYLCWATAEYKVDATASVPVHSALSFDLTVTSLYPALLAGGSIELLPDDVGVEALIAALRRRPDRALVKLTPSHLELLTAQLPPTELAGLTRLLVVGGEQLTAEMVQPWRVHAPATRIINEYGPTETVVGCCTYEVQPSDSSQGPVAIGRPIANTALYVLDPGGAPVARGDIGELYIGGRGVARGYLNRPALTAERFLADPFGGDPDAKMYRTGDLVRIRDGEVLEYVGRADEQIKLRGHRIEPGEIEGALLSHEAVRSAVVVVREDRPGDKQLVAYVIPCEGQKPAPELLREFLRGRLPAYMVPAQVVALEAFPLTGNGKLDRQALPAPVHAPLASTAALDTPTESAVADIWRDLLRVPAVGPDDNFFLLGGHSLLALQAVARMGQTFGVDVQLRHMVEYPTLRELAGAVDGFVSARPASASAAVGSPRDASRTADASSALVPLQPHGAGVPIFGVPGHNGDVLCYRALADELSGEAPFFALQPPGGDAGGEPLASVETLAAYFADEIQAARPEGPYVLVGYCAGGTIAFALARELQARGAIVERVVLLGAPHPSAFRYQLARRAIARATAMASRPTNEANRRYLASLAKRLRVPKRSSEREIEEIMERRRPLERATLSAIRRYTPQRVAARLVMVLPNREWLHSAFAPHRWRPLADDCESVFLDTTCTVDGMLKRPHVQAIADVFRARTATSVSSDGQAVRL